MIKAARKQKVEGSEKQDLPERNKKSFPECSQLLQLLGAVVMSKEEVA